MYRESERRIDLQSIKKNWPHHIDKLTNKNRNHRKCIYERLQTQRERNEEKKSERLKRGEEERVRTKTGSNSCGM